MPRPATAAVRLLTGEREPVRLATTANIALTGLQTIDGVLTEVGDRVLVKNQTDATANGIYTASAGQWYRTSDARTSRTMQKGTTLTVQDGVLNAGKTFRFNTSEPAVGSDAIEIIEYPLGGLPNIIRDYLDVGPYVLTRAALKALDSTKDLAAILLEEGREEIFIWRTGDYSAAIAADVPERSFIKANAVASSAGAWVRASKDGLVNVLSFIPSIHWAGIFARTITSDLSGYIQAAFDYVGVNGGELIFPAGRYSHATGLVFGPQATSYTPTGDDTTSDLHFMQVPQSVIYGVGFAELYATAAMTAQLTITYQNGKQAPSGTRVEGMFFNGHDLAERGIKCLWTFNPEYSNNRFDAHTVVNFEHEGRAHLRVEHNIFRGPKNVLMRLGGDNNFIGNDFYVKGTASAVRRCIEFGPSTGNTIVGKDNVFTLEAGFNPGNTNAVAIYIDGISTYSSTTGNRDIQIDGCEFHGFEYGVLAEGSSGTNLKNIDIINCHSFTGTQSKTCLAKIDTARSVHIINNRSNTIGTTRSTLPGLILDAVENAEIACNFIGGVTGIEAVRVEGNSVDVAIHDNHFLEAVNTAHPYVKVDASSLVTIRDNHAQQYSAYTTKFVQETGAGSGNVYGNNHLSTTFTDPYDVANSNTTYRGADYSGASQSTVAAGATVYIGDNGSQSAEYLTAWMNPSKAKYAKRLAVQVNAAPGASQTFTYTLNVDGVDTALTCQISGAGVFSAFDIDREALVSLGSRFAVKLVTSAGAAVTAHRVALTLA